jgi:hypothetical protein
MTHDTRVRETSPAASLDADQALGAALDVVQGWDAPRFGTTAIHYAFGCQRRALGHLALRVRDGSAAPAASGWALETGITNQAPNVINMLMHHPKEPGGWLIQVEYALKTTPEASARIDELDKASGKSLIELVLEPLPEVEAIEANPASYVPLHDASEVKAFAIRAIDMGARPVFGRGGVPYGADPEKVEPVSDLWPAKVTLDGHSAGHICRLKSPEEYYGSVIDGLELEHERFMDAPALLVLQRLQEIFDANDLGPLVASEAERLSAEAFKIIGSGCQEVISNAAVAIVNADDGRISKRTVQAASALEQALISRNLASHLERVDTLVAGLREQGACSEETGVRTSYENAWLASSDGQDLLMVDTQNGLFSISWGDAEISIACQYGGQHYPIAHFLRDDDKLQGAWAPEGEGVVIPYLPRNILSLNYIANTLPGVAASYEPPSAPAP